MKNFKKYFDTFMCLCLSSLLISSTILSKSDVKALDFDMLGGASFFSTFSSVEKQKEELLEKQCFRNGKQTALDTNELKNNKQAFKKQVRKILNEYYSTSKFGRNELKNFENYIDNSAKQIVDNYKEAEKERENQENLDYETGTVIVSFPYGTSMDTIDSIMTKEAEGYEIIDDGEVHIADDLDDFRKQRLEKIKNWKSDIVVSADVKLEDTVERAESKFEKYDCVKSATDNILFEADGTIKTGYTATTNDPLFNESQQWNLNNVDAPRAWYKFKSVNTLYVPRIAVIDCGVQMNHKELSGLLMKSKSVDVTQNNKRLIDCKDKKSATGQYTGVHGTGVASVLAARGNNSFAGAGIASIANNSDFRNCFEIMAIKCDSSVDRDRHVTKEHLASAINYAVTNGADVISISYGAPRGDYSATDFKALETAVKRAVAAEICVVCSAGNDATTTVRYPVGFSGVIGVGATWKNGSLAEYSNESSAVDIVAPGGYSNGAQILVAAPTTMVSKGYRYSQGTSYATPLVAGTVAMMMSINCTLTPAQYLSRLQSRSTSTANGRKTNKKFKVLNAGKAVALMEEK